MESETKKMVSETKKLSRDIINTLNAVVPTLSGEGAVIDLRQESKEFEQLLKLVGQQMGMIAGRTLYTPSCAHLQFNRTESLYIDALKLIRWIEQTCEFLEDSCQRMVIIRIHDKVGDPIQPAAYEALLLSLAGLFGYQKAGYNKHPNGAEYSLVKLGHYRVGSPDPHEKDLYVKINHYQ